jgi:hypothetical protein
MISKPALAVITLVIGAVLLFLSSFVSLQAQSSASVTCTLPFEATIRQGPSAGHALIGTLNFIISADKSIRGSFVRKDQQDIPVMGRAEGRAIHLAFDLSSAAYPGVYIFGVGTAIEPVESEGCGTALGGPFVGPLPGDSGDWLVGSSGSNAAKQPSMADLFGNDG